MAARICGRRGLCRGIGATGVRRTVRRQKPVCRARRREIAQAASPNPLPRVTVFVVFAAVVPRLIVPVATMLMVVVAFLITVRVRPSWTTWRSFTAILTSPRWRPGRAYLRDGPAGEFHGATSRRVSGRPVDLVLHPARRPLSAENSVGYGLHRHPSVRGAGSSDLPCIPPRTSTRPVLRIFRAARHRDNGNQHRRRQGTHAGAGRPDGAQRLPACRLARLARRYLCRLPVRRQPPAGASASPPSSSSRITWAR